MPATRAFARRLLQHATVAYDLARPAQPLGVLERVGRARVALSGLEREAVAQARDGGATWQTIADALDEPKQTVHERHASQRSRPKGVGS